MKELIDTQRLTSWLYFIEKVSRELQFNQNPKTEWLELPNAPQATTGKPARTHCLRWPNPSGRLVVIMAGGVVNLAHRFRYLAECLSNDHECIAYDWYGRGYSDWLLDEADYGFKTHVRQTEALIEHVADGRPVIFLGSSLGGLAAMALNHQALSHIRGLILNDVGPSMFADRRIRRAKALSIPRVFNTPEELSYKLGVAEKNAGYIPPWIRHYLSLENTVWVEQGRSRTYRYDMACMAKYAQEANTNIDLWHSWQGLQCPQLLLHGMQSDALGYEQIDKMENLAGGAFKLVEFEQTGHTPSLCVPEQTQVIRNWLSVEFHFDE